MNKSTDGKALRPSSSEEECSDALAHAANLFLLAADAGKQPAANTAADAGQAANLFFLAAADPNKQPTATTTPKATVPAASLDANKKPSVPPQQPPTAATPTTTSYPYNILQYPARQASGFLASQHRLNQSSLPTYPAGLQVRNPAVYAAILSSATPPNNYYPPSMFPPGYPPLSNAASLRAAGMGGEMPSPLIQTGAMISPYATGGAMTSTKLQIHNSKAPPTVPAHVLQRQMAVPSPKPMVIVEKPGPGDVLLGKGKFFQNHEGNVKFREIIDERREEYDRSQRKMLKTTIAFQVVDIIQKERKGRFLERYMGLDGKEGWLEVDDRRAREKVALCFRSKRRQHSVMKLALAIAENEKQEELQSQNSEENGEKDSGGDAGETSSGAVEEDNGSKTEETNQDKSNGEVSITAAQKKKAMTILRQQRSLAHKEKKRLLKEKGAWSALLHDAAKEPNPPSQQVPPANSFAIQRFLQQQQRRRFHQWTSRDKK